MQISCYKCDAPLAAGDVNLQQALAKCGKCRAVFHLKLDQRPRPPVERPSRFAIKHNGSETLITYRWSRLVGLLFGAGSITWNGAAWTMLIVIYLDGQLTWYLFLFLMVFVISGLALVYIALGHLVNTTTIRATPSALSVAHGPLPWFRNRTLDPARIDQLSSHERVVSNKDGTSTSYELIAHMIGGKQIRLVAALDKPDHALYLEQQLEAALVIDDRPMAGEIRR